jgi:hypothetical protein
MKMNTRKEYTKIWFMILLLVTFVAGCGSSGSSSGGDVGVVSPATTAAAADAVSYTNPEEVATDVAVNSTVNATMKNAATLNSATFTVREGSAPVSGTVTSVGTTAIFTPTTEFKADTEYTAEITAEDTTEDNDRAEGAVSKVSKVWSFKTGQAKATGPAPVLLGLAGNYVILAKTGISTTGTTAVTGNIGVSPIAASSITGFALVVPPTTFSTSPYVTGKVYAADYAAPTPSNLTTAVLDMQTAFTDAAGRSLPDFTELYAGDISGRTLVPGLYKWGTGVLITSAGVTLSGGANDIWIFQIAQNLTVSNSAIITLSGGAQAKNIFWQVSGQATLGTAADFKGIILSQTLVSMNTGAKMHGRLLAQTAVTLIANKVTNP